MAKISSCTGLFRLDKIRLNSKLRSTAGDLLAPGISHGIEDRQPPQHTIAARVHQGYSTVKGLLKTENQDRIVTLRGQMPASTSRPLAESTTSRYPQGGRLLNSEPPPSSGGVSSSRDATLLFSAVFDGHGGLDTSSLAAEWVHDIAVASNHELWETLGHSGNGCDVGKSTMNCSWELLEGNMEIDKVGDCMVQELRLWREAFSQLDDKILQQSRDSGQLDGATALAAVHAGPFLSVANAGDSRAVLSRDKVAVRLTRDHTPEMESERRRIERAGGVVRHVKGVWRVCVPTYDGQYIKLCATSRGLGDRDFKDEGLLICEPEVTNVVLQPHVDQFSVMASDGLWGFVTDQEVVDTVNGVLEEFSKMTSVDISMQTVAAEAAKRLVKLALDGGSFDDISVLVNVYVWRE